MGRKRLVEDETRSVSPMRKKIRTSAFVPSVADMGELSKGGVVQEQAVDAAVHVSCCASICRKVLLTRTHFPMED